MDQTSCALEIHMRYSGGLVVALSGQPGPPVRILIEIRGRGADWQTGLEQRLLEANLPFGDGLQLWQASLLGLPYLRGYLTLPTSDDVLVATTQLCLTMNRVVESMP